jgi:hypothetical protein
MQLIRVVPNPPSESGLTLTQGTKLMIGDVDISRGVTSVTLHCEVNDVWRATIECNVEPPADLAALAFIRYPTHWDRLRVWLRRLVRRD